MWGLNWTQTWSNHNDNLKLSANICNWSVEWGLHFRAINHCKLSLWLHRAPHHMGQKLWQACQRWLVLPHHSVCLMLFLLSVRAIHLRGPLLREEWLEDKHLRHEWAQMSKRNDQILIVKCSKMLKHQMTKLRTSMMYHLPKADTHDGKCNKDTPDHSSLVQIFCSMTSLGDNNFYGRLSLKVKSMLVQGSQKVVISIYPYW